MDHLPIGEQALEVPLEVLLGLDGRIGNMNALRRRWPPSVGPVTVT
jgi:hypothetical protein